MRLPIIPIGVTNFWPVHNLISRSVNHWQWTGHSGLISYPPKASSLQWHPRLLILSLSVFISRLMLPISVTAYHTSTITDPTNKSFHKGSPT